MKTAALALALIFVGQETNVVAAADFTSDLARRSKAVGPRRALTEIAGDDVKWAKFHALIARGDERTMRLAMKLHRVADGHVAEDIAHAFGEALKTNPTGALSIGGAEISIDILCGPPDVDEPAFDSRDRALRELRRRRAALARTHGASRASDCLTRLAAAETGIRRFYKK